MFLRCLSICLIGLNLVLLVTPAFADEAQPLTKIWTRDIPGMRGCMGIRGTVDGAGNVWIVCPDFDLKQGKVVRSLIEVSPDSDILLQKPFALNVKTIAKDESPDEISVADSGSQIAFLVSMGHAVGRTEYFDGAFFVPLIEGSLGKPVQVTKSGPQFIEFQATPDGGFIAGGDQEPLTLMKLTREGAVQWSHILSMKQYLPKIAVNLDGMIASLSQTDKKSMVFQLFNSDGKPKEKLNLFATQGTIQNVAENGWAVLYIKNYASTENPVYLRRLDPDLKKLWEIKTPLMGIGGRTFQLISVGDGFVAAGEWQVLKPMRVVAMDKNGAVEWQDTFPSPKSDFMLIPAANSFYLVYSQGPDRLQIDKYSQQ